MAEDKKKTDETTKGPTTGNRKPETETPERANVTENQKPKLFAAQLHDNYMTGSSCSGTRRTRRQDRRQELEPETGVSSSRSS